MRCCKCVSVLTLNSVVEVLEKHGLQKPISYVKNSQNSEEEAHQLMVKLCRHTGRKYVNAHICMNADPYDHKCLSRSHELTETCMCVQKPSCEWDGVERSTAGPAWHAAECLHLSETRDMSPGIAPQQKITRNNLICTKTCHINLHIFGPYVLERNL